MTLQPESNRQLIQQRLVLLYVAVVVVFLILGVRLWQLQIIEGAEFAEKAEHNRVRAIQVVAPRGTINDRFGSPLVENRASFNILLYREFVKDLSATSAYITGNLGVTPEDLTKLLQRSRSTGLYHPLVIKQDVGIEDISVVETHKRDHPEIQLGPVPRRLYRYGNLAAHVLGYVGEISEQELSRGAFPEATAGDLVGKYGIERVYNRFLTGDDGRRQVLVDSLGREVGLLDEADSVVGGELRLTLDLEVQKTAENLLADKVGAIVALDPRNGEILAMASAPSFDPNKFSTRISEEDWDSLIEDANKPLQNRAIQNSYSPGSTFKVIMAEAGLEENLIEHDTHVYCNGSAVFYNRVFHCADHNGHGYVDLRTAIARSCNIFFYDLGRRMGIERISQHASELGLGRRTGVDLPNERSGVMPSPAWKQQVRHAKWYPGETISVAIGQGAVSATPLQILRAVSAIAVGGKLSTPHLLLEAERASEARTWAESRTSLSAESARRIKEGMWGSVNDGGSGHNAAIPGLDICGKTGTVQVMSNEKRKELNRGGSEFEDHSWFVGFASRDNPEIAVVAFVEHGGKGGIAAAPLAREIFRTYFSRRGHPEMLSQLTGRRLQ